MKYMCRYSLKVENQDHGNDELSHACWQEDLDQRVSLRVYPWLQWSPRRVCIIGYNGSGGHWDSGTTLECKCIKFLCYCSQMEQKYQRIPPVWSGLSCQWLQMYHLTPKSWSLKDDFYGFVEFIPNTSPDHSTVVDSLIWLVQTIWSY